MKIEYPNYFQKMREIESNVSPENLEVLNEYLKFCTLSAGKEKTQQRKRYALQFLDIAEYPYKDFNRETIEHIYNLIKQTDREICGKNETIKQLKYFIRWLKDDENLLKGLKAISQRKRFNTKKINPSTLPTEEEIKELFTACMNDHKKIAMISLQTELGLRPQELLGLKWKDITTEGDIGEAKIFSNKTKETRVLPFKASVLHLERWKQSYHFTDIKPNDLIFPNPYLRKQQLYRTYLSSLYRQLCQRTGMRNIYPYLCRHKKMTEANKKMPSKVASAYGGHSEKTASMYTHLSEADIREVVLKQMYDIKEPDIKSKQKLQKQIDELTKKVNEMKPIYETTTKEREELTKYFTKIANDSIKKYEKNMKKIKERGKE